MFRFVVALASVLLAQQAFADELPERFVITQRNAELADTYVVDWNVPQAPAFALLGLDASAAQTPRDQEDFAVSIAGLFDEDGTLKTGMGLTTRPYWWGAPEITLDEYRAQSWWERTLLGQLRLSLATAPVSGDDDGVRVAAGATFQLMSAQDPRNDVALEQCLDTVANERAGIIEDASKALYEGYYNEQLARSRAANPRFSEDEHEEWAEDRALVAMQAARAAQLDENAAYQTYLGHLAECRSDWQERQSKAPSWLLSIGQAFQSEDGEAENLEAEGASVWTSYTRTFGLGPERADTHTTFTAYGRYTQDEILTIDDDTTAEADVGVAAIMLRRARDDRWDAALTVSYNSQEFTDDAIEDREFTQVSVSANWRVNDTMWLQAFYGGRGNEDEEVFTLGLVFDWGDDASE